MPNNNNTNNANNNAANNNAPDYWSVSDDDRANLDTLSKISSVTSKYDEAIDIIDRNCHVDKLKYFKEDVNDPNKKMPNPENPIRQILENSITLKNRQHKENQIRYEYMRIMKALGINNINADNEFCKMMLAVDPKGTLKGKILLKSSLEKLYNGYLNLSKNHSDVLADCKVKDDGTFSNKDKQNVQAIMFVLLKGMAQTGSSAAAKKDATLKDIYKIVTDIKDSNNIAIIKDALSKVKDILDGNNN